jgi:transcriptional regulator with GAF, ATPase, and Fis domain
MIDENTAPEVEVSPSTRDVVHGVLWLWPEERLLPLGEGRVTLGRDETATAQLHGPLVSRLHASITGGPSGYLLRDEGSRNGTRLNGVLVQEAPLGDGDVLRVGDWVGVMTRMAGKLARSRQFFVETPTGIVLGPSTQRLWQRVIEVAGSSLPVLVQAPTGAGKEVFARALHDMSGRPGRFVAQNCAALPDSLAESQLFGHTRGAFTGAQSAAPGLFLAADRGTLLLDEIADLPLSQQAKLLRVVEEHEVTALGETTARRVDVRIIAACQFPLPERVARGLFRADLYARLAGSTIVIPPLSGRREEGPRLFIKFFREFGGDERLLDAQLIETVVLHEWPLNVREIRLTAQELVTEPSIGEAAGLSRFLRRRFTVLAREARELDATRARPSVHPAATDVGKRRSAWLLRNGEHLAALKAAIRAHGGVLARAARAVGISRQRALRLLEAERERTSRAT